MLPANDRFWEGVFRGLNTELHWLQSADRLKRGADVLFAAYLESCGLPPEERSQTDDRFLDGVATLLVRVCSFQINQKPHHLQCQWGFEMKKEPNLKNFTKLFGKESCPLTFEK